MLTLVQFTDKSLGIYPSNKIKNINGVKCIVKHNGWKYEAEVISSNDSKDALMKIEENICNNTKSISEPLVQSDAESLQSDMSHAKISDISQSKCTPEPLIKVVRLENMSLQSDIIQTNVADISLLNWNGGRSVSLQNDVFQVSEPIGYSVRSDAISPQSDKIQAELPNTSQMTSNSDHLVLLERSSNEVSLQSDITQADMSIQNNITYPHISGVSVLPGLENYSFGSELINLNNTIFSEDSDNGTCNRILSFNEVENIETSIHFSAVENVQHDRNTNERICKKFPDSVQDDEDVDTVYQHCEEDGSDDDDNDPLYQPSQDEASEEEGCQSPESGDIPSPRNEIPKKPNRFSDSLIQPNTSRCDDTEMYVNESRGRKGDKKANFCLYCMTKQQKIARHLETKHKEEKEVKKFINLPKGNSERRTVISNIRKKGNFLFNTVSQHNDGELIVSRRPSKNFNRSAIDFKACANCKAFFSKNTLRVHFRHCSGDVSSTKRITQLLSRKVASRVHAKASAIVKKDLIPVLREDDITRLIRYDELVIIYANKMTEKYRNPRHFDMIRQRMRLIGRFLMILKRIDKEITDLSSIFDPKFSDNTMRAINEAARFNDITCIYEAPTVAFSIGSLLKQIGNFFVIECVKNHQDVKGKNAKNFLKLLTQEINISVNRNVTESQVQLKRRQRVVLPSIDDIRKLHSYITKIRKQSLLDIQKKMSIEVWTQLAETTLMSIQLFNRRRAGEVERILIEDFNSYQGIDEETDKDLFKSLNGKNRQVAKKYVRFTIRGKLNRTVPVLLDNNLLDCVKMILKYREHAGVPVENPYVFGIQGRLEREFKYLRACNLMRKFSELCGVEHPERLRGTQLRKHIATTCITLNLEEQEISDLANFMGHAEKIHKDIYRQPVKSRDILRMSRLLEVAQGADSGTESESDCEVDETNTNKSIRSTHTSKVSPSKHNQNSRKGKPPSSYESDSDVENSPGNCGRTKYTAINDGNKPKQKKRSTSPYGPVKRTRWTDEERDLIYREFATNIKNRTLPSLKNIQHVIRQNPIIQDRTSPQVKTWIHNQFKKSKK